LPSLIATQSGLDVTTLNTAFDAVGVDGLFQFIDQEQVRECGELNHKLFFTNVTLFKSGAILIIGDDVVV